MADVLYVIRHIPGNDAPTTRVAGLLSLFAKNGYSVDIMSTAATDDAAIDMLGKDGPAPLLRPRRNSGTVAKALEMLTSFSAIRAIKHYIQLNSPKLVIFYGGTSNLVRAVRDSRSADAPAILVDETDWFDPRTVRTWRNRIYYYFDNIRIKTVDEHLDGQIVISPYFRDYFEAKGCTPFFLPPVFTNLDRSACSTESLDQHTPSRHHIQLVYAGSLGDGKDMIAPLVQAVRRHNEDPFAKRIKLVIVGPTWSDLAQAVGGTQDQHSAHGITVLGRKTRGEVLRIVADSDFSVLLRQDARYAKAGFSTKLAESMTCGTPVLCNRVGGADSVLENWVDGVIFDAISLESLATVLNQATSLSRDELVALRHNAKKKADAVFDSSVYVASFGDYIRNILTGADGEAR